MCFEYYEWKQRQDEMRRRESLERQKRRDEPEREPARLDQDEWAIPDEPIHIREKVPS